VLRDRAASGQRWANAHLVRVLLDEGEHDQAWEAAQSGGCTDELWLTLAERRATDHPAGAIGVYQRLAEGRIDQRNKSGYRAAAELVERIRDLDQRTGHPSMLATYFEQLRTRHKPKRSLMAELARRGL
jgi:uncharacterized Zn finger protein